MNKNNLSWADDTAVIADSEKNLLLISTLNEACDTQNTCRSKTEVLVLAKEPEQCSLLLNNPKNNQTDTFKYVGTLVALERRFAREINCRIAQSKVAFNTLSNILTLKSCLRDKIQSFLLYVDGSICM